jgi:hypothetical protein
MRPQPLPADEDSTGASSLVRGAERACKLAHSGLGEYLRKRRQATIQAFYAPPILQA